MKEIVSILIPVYNRERLIERTLESALNQTYPHLEVIVSDNKSTDGTWDILQQWAKKDSRLKIFQNEENLGPLYNWIAGLQHCTGEFLKILWSDDTLSPECILECLTALKNDPQAGLVYTSTMIHLKDKDIPAYHHPESTQSSSEAYTLNTILARDLPVSPGCAMIRRKDALFSDFQDGDPRLHDIAKKFGAGPDVFFLLHAASKYSKVLHIPRFLSHFYGGEESFTLANRKEVSLGYKLTFQHLLNRDPFIKKLRNKVKRIQIKDKIKKTLSKIF
ncbi:MAG: glycosyltransferase involved in cell wall biosynthesis [Chlamydiales bacterium]|jgi:glycosyltransferase involved in cell wall biosynthesis